MQKVTMRDVARTAGVSIATVSHVINHTHYVGPTLKVRVEEAIESLNYRPNKLARALNTKGIPLLALIVPDISNPFWSSVARAVQDVTDKHNYSVIVCSSDGILDREVRFLRSLTGWVSGVIFHPYHVSQVTVREIIGVDLPMVIIGSFKQEAEPAENWDHVLSNNLESAQQVITYLMQLGHRRIAFIQGPEGTPTSGHRLAGFRKAFEVAGIPLQESLIVPGDYTREGGRRGMRSLLELLEPPTAVFCANDFSALGALEIAQQKGFRVPEDLSIVGFDDIREASYASPPLTTVRQPPDYVGTITAETLLDRLNGRQKPARIRIEGSLIRRQSTAPPRVTSLAVPNKTYNQISSSP
jgi:LacI family transcriptional regulator